LNKWTQAFEWNRASAEPAGRRSAPVEHHYFAFLSYSHKDAADADWLHGQLERFRVPSSLAGKLTANGVIPKRLTPIFRDRHELAAADDLGEEIREGLTASRCLIVLCSPAAAKSKWVNAEIILFKRLHPEGCIIAAIIAGEPLASPVPGSQAEDCFPPALRQKYDRRGRPTGKRAEPLAADLREGKGGRRIGVLKIVAGILGVGLDDLVKRNEVRKHRRMATISAASIVGMLVAIALAVTAIQARDAARDQRREAEGLIGYMLGDLKDKLEPIGRLDVLDGVGERVLEYYHNQQVSDLPDAGLMQRAQALSLTAQVAYLRGNYDDATRLYREAMAGTSEALNRSPDDPKRLFDHAQNVFWMGEIARDRGRLDEAEAYYREYKRLADRMTAIEPDNLKWRMEVLYANENLGIALKSKRQFTEAGQLFGSILGPLQSFVSLEPNNVEYQQTLSNALGWFADNESALGHLDSAIAARERQISFMNEFISGRNRNVELQERLIPAHEGLGILLAARGKLEQANVHFRLALAEANGLLAIEPNNSGWRDLEANTQLQLARNLLAIGNNAEAAEQTSKGCAAAEALRARTANVVRWQHLQTMCLLMRARLALASNQTSQAITFSERALLSARSERSGDTISDRYIVAMAGRVLGDMKQHGGDSAGAAAAWSASLAQLPVNATERPAEINERVELLHRLGREQEAKRPSALLRSMGFRSHD
jgi:tetratricopeptide (TPR) repeat protein